LTRSQRGGGLGPGAPFLFGGALALAAAVLLAALPARVVQSRE
jgi:hypothetical protein